MAISYKRRYNVGYGSNKRFRPSYPRYLPFQYGASALAAGASSLYNYFSGSKKKTPIGGAGVTTQYDRKTVYRKKYMPKRKKKQWKRFVRKVKASLLKDVGTKTVVLNSSLSQIIGTDAQSWVSVCFYGKNGAADSATSCGHRDLFRIFTNDPDLHGATATTQRAQFFSGVIDLTIANNSYAETTQATENLSIEVDIYEIIFGKDGIDADRISALINDAISTTPAIAGGGSEVTLNARGCTPFDLPDMLAKGVKIVKKTKYMLSKGQCATYQFRDPRNYSFRSDVVWDNDNNFAIKNKTRGFIVLFKGVPTATPDFIVKRIDVGVTRKYGYKIIEQNSDADQYNP